MGSFLKVARENIHLNTLENFFKIVKHFKSEEMDLGLVICQMSVCHQVCLIFSSLFLINQQYCRINQYFNEVTQLPLLHC